MKNENDPADDVDALRRELAEARRTIAALTGDGLAASAPRLLHDAQEELERRERLFRAVFDESLDAILLADDDGRYVDANPAACAMFGLARADLLGRSAADFAAGDFDTGAAHAAFRETGHQRGHFPLVRADGTRRDLEYHATTSILPGLHLSVLRDVTDALRAEKQYRLLFESSPHPKWLTDAATARFLAINDAGLRLLGHTREEILQMTCLDIVPERDASRAPKAAVVADERGGAHHGICSLKRRDGTLIEVDIHTQRSSLDGRDVMLVVGEDVTNRKSLEAQLAQSQKMEAIGSLAGGVAHDFNNLLSVILTYTSFALEELSPADPLRADIEEIAKAGRRAAGLTRQLLAFSRRQILEPRIMDLNSTVAGIEQMLRRLVGENIEIKLQAADGLGKIHADAGQIEQVLMNLVVNARDAMPDGGELTIETANVERGEGELSALDGPCVMLRVTDTGTGMDAATRQRIFEPFFTTKQLGKGTGLGLSTVLGITQQSGGMLRVHSEPGRGATFEILLPRVDDGAEAKGAALPASHAPRGAETILVVEDDDQVRTLVATILRRNGYHVLDARNAGEALLLCEQHAGTIHLLLTDVVMPRMSGRQLAERLAPMRASMKVLFMSGYTDDEALRRGALDAGIALLQKPVTPDALARKVRAVLDAPAVAPIEA